MKLRAGAACVVAAALAVTAGVLACATTPLRAPVADVAALPSSHALASVDWRAAGDEAFADLRSYLMADTTNPPGNERRGAEVLAALLAGDGIEAAVLPLHDAPERANLIARLPASAPSGQGALCLISHLDVVSAEPSRWPAGRGPFDGAVSTDDASGEQLVWGRGALDMKVLGLLEVATLRWLKRLQVPLTRDVVLLAVADEEVASKGMVEALAQHWDQLGCSHAVNEGGLGIEDALVDGQVAFGISVAEKGVLWLRVRAVGEPGHGSTPVPRAPQRLLEALDRVRAWQRPARVHPALYQLLAEVGNEAGGVTGFVLQRPLLVDWFALDRFLSEPAASALVTDTVNITGFAGAKEPNVVPSEVSAQLDVRLLPGTEPAALTAELRARLAGIEGVTVEVIDQRAAAESPWDDPLYRALAHHAEAVARADGVARIVVGPMVSPGFTDSILLREKGVRAYGFVPVIVSRKEAATMHGDGERVSKRNVARGLKALLSAVVDVAAAPSALSGTPR
ncbi:MAG: M20/M25/M40 family metallo-hydrolase [Deltaproteobacteria bacterium]|nr:M20/M25/M40 family metallo-hydrolase [Deltaproteobacteria bacterium]